MKIFDLWTGRSNFLRKTLPRVAKGAFHVYTATLWEKDDKSKLNCLWLLWDFALLWFTMTEKIALGVKTTNYAYRGKNFGDFFGRECFFANIFGIWAEELGNRKAWFWKL